MKPSRTFDQLLAAYPADVQTLALAAQKQLKKWLPKVEETVDSSAPVISYGFGPGYRGMVCTLILSKKGVKLGIVRGTELTDPHGLLGGSGKVHRYVQLHTASDLRTPGVRELIEAALRAWQARS